jgi:hypothetical protein
MSVWKDSEVMWLLLRIVLVIWILLVVLGGEQVLLKKDGKARDCSVGPTTWQRST